MTPHTGNGGRGDGPTVRPSLYDPQVYRDSLARVENLTPETRPLWGKMDVAGMLYHLHRTQDMTSGAPFHLEWYRSIPMRLARPILRQLGLGSQPYIRRLPTHPKFVPGSGRDFNAEKKQLLASLEAFHRSDATARTDHPVFGPLSGDERGYLSWRHMDHHLRQFGV